MEKLLKGVKATNTGVTMMKSDLSSKNHLVNSHSTSIKRLEQQMSQLSATLNQRKSGRLSSDTVQNPQNDGSCIAITTQSGKVLPCPSVGKAVINDVIKDGAEDDETRPVESEKLDGNASTSNNQQVDELKKRRERKRRQWLLLSQNCRYPFPID